MFFLLSFHPHFSHNRISFYYEFSKEQDYICSKPDDSGMHLCSNLPPYRIGPLVCNGKMKFIDIFYKTENKEKKKFMFMQQVNSSSLFIFQLGWYILLAPTLQLIQFDKIGTSKLAQINTLWQMWEISLHWVLDERREQSVVLNQFNHPCTILIPKKPYSFALIWV